MGLFVQGLPTVGVGYRGLCGGDFVQSFDLGRDVEERFCTEKETGSRPFVTACETQIAVQVGVRCARFKAKVFRSAFGVESSGDGQRFEQRGFSAAVFADEKRYARIEREAVEFFDRGKIEGIGIE
ncbi:MAG: hypothetical protein QM760_03650 [Nibricoccus sp.]